MNLKDIFRSTDDPYAQHSYVKLGLPQREREIFESADFDYVGGVLLRREERESDMPEYLRLHNIMSRTGMCRTDAMKYRKYLTQIAPNLYRTFESWMKQRGIEPGLRYFRHLAMQLHAEDTPSDDYLSQRGDDSYTSDYWHPVEGGTPWILKQPRWARNFVQRPRRIGSLVALRSLGRDCYEAGQMENRELMSPLQRTYTALSHDQQSVFWTNYSIQKQKLESAVRLGASARKIIARIEDAPSSRLGYVGAMLYRMQKGEVPIKDPPARDEWQKIWSAYRKRKAGVGSSAQRVYP